MSRVGDLFLRYWWQASLLAMFAVAGLLWLTVEALDSDPYAYFLAGPVPAITLPEGSEPGEEISARIRRRTGYR